MDQEPGADTSQREAAALFSMESEEPAHEYQDLYGAPDYHGYEDPLYHGESSEVPFYGHDALGYEQEPTYVAQTESAPLDDTEYYPPYGDGAAEYGAGADAFDPEQMLETMSDPEDGMGDSRTLEPIPEHESDESRAEKEYETEVHAPHEAETQMAPEAPEQAPPADGHFASHNTEPWTWDASSAAPAPADAFTLEEAPCAPQEDSLPALAQPEGPVGASEVPIDAPAAIDPEAERLVADLADALAQLEALRTECEALTGAKQALEAQLETQRGELEQCRHELAVAQEQRLASERTNADRMTKLQHEHRAALQALQSEHRATMDAMGQSDAASPAALQERRVSSLVRAHKRSATTSLSSSRMSLADAEAGEFLPRRQPSEKPRMRRDAALTPSQAHHRQASLQMLRARMASDAEDGAGPAPPTSTLSIVQDEHRVASNVQDQVEMARTHSHQFSQDALLFCSSCQGDLIIV